MTVKLIVIDVRGSLQQRLNSLYDQLKEYKSKEYKSSLRELKMEIAKLRSQYRVDNYYIGIAAKEGVLAGYNGAVKNTEQTIKRIETSLTTSALWAESEERPVRIMNDAFPDDVRHHFGVYRVKGKDVAPARWLFRNATYLVLGNYTDSEKSLLIQEFQDAARRKFERLQHKFSLAASMDSKADRPRIPEEVRVAVWRRDNGCCVRCGSRERLEYDHIIPLSRGGSNTVRNIELLCETCNRSKGSEIQ